MMRSWYLGVALVLIAAMATACRCSDAGPAATDAGIADSTKVESNALPVNPENNRHNLLGSLSSCQFEHDGWVLDLGSHSDAASRDFVVTAYDDDAVVERAGGTYLKIPGSRTSYSFWIGASQIGATVRVKLFGAGARGLTAFIDEKRVGSARIAPDEVQILRLNSSSMELGPGRHSLMLHFWGRSRDRRELPQSEIDWIQVGDGDDQHGGTYEAPTMRSVLVDREIDRRPKRSLALMAPGTVRCVLRPAADSELSLALAFWGSGRGTAEVRIVSEDEPPVTLRQQKLTGGSGATWTPLRLDLKPFANRVVGLELRAIDSSPGGRVLFGEPALVRADAEKLRVPSVDTVVLVVGAGLDRRRVPPYSAAGQFPALASLARMGASFTNYHVPTTVPAGAFASILTALPPELHKVRDQSARLPMAIKTVASIVKEAAGRTALFTGVPTSFEAFGFNNGWDDYAEFSPVHDVPATEPLVRAIRWLEAHLDEHEQPKLLVVHTRGAHPPWDLPKTLATELPPKEYSGPIDARRGGIVLGKIRARTRERTRRIDKEDWQRIHALADSALALQSREIGRLLEVIERADASQRTLFIFVGDVAVGDPPSLPYDPAAPLTDDHLLAPLIVRFPDGAFAGKSVSVPVSAVDIGSTIADALGIQFPSPRSADDLYAAAAGINRLGGRVLVSSLGNAYATQLGPWRLMGKLGRAPTLCRMDIDPACTTDKFDSAFYVARELWQATHDQFAVALEETAGPPEREPASINPETAAALTVWGDIE